MAKQLETQLKQIRQLWPVLIRLSYTMLPHGSHHPGPPSLPLISEREAHKLASESYLWSVTECICQIQECFCKVADGSSPSVCIMNKDMQI